jgi:hypothetical protein
MMGCMCLVQENVVGLTVELSPEACRIMDRLRGALSRDAFLNLLLKVCDARAVSDVPDWAKTPRNS